MIILLIFVAYEYGYRNIQENIATIKEQQDIKTKTLQKYIALIAEKPELEKRLISVKELRKESDAKIIDGKTPSMAAATLVDTAKSTISARGGRVMRENVEKTEELGKFKLITVSLDVFMPEPSGLSEIIYNIETRSPYLVIKELDLRVQSFVTPRELTYKLNISALNGAK